MDISYYFTILRVDPEQYQSISPFRLEGDFLRSRSSESQ